MTSVHRQRRRALLAFVLLFLLAGIGATRIQVTDDASGAMLPTDPDTIARYSDYLKRFPSDQGALVVFENLLCSEDGWKLIRKAEQAFRKEPSIDRTLSLASMSSRYVVGNGDSVDLSRFADVDFESGQARCEAAARYGSFRNVLVSADTRATALFLIARGDDNATEFSNTLTRIYAPLAAEATALGGRMIITGEAIVSAELSRVVARDSLLVGSLLVAMLVLVFIVTRSLLTTGVALVLSAFVLACSYGFMGWVGMELTPATSLVIFLLVPLTGTFVIHAHGYVARQSDSDRKLIPDESRMSCAFAGLTTAIGFACTGMTPAPDIQALAIMGVVGIIASTIGVFLFVFPALYGTRNLRFAVAFSVPRWPLIYSYAGIGLLAFFLLAIGWGLSRLKIDYSPTDYLPMSNPYRADYEAAGEWFGRMNLPLMISAENVEDPEIWLKLKPLVDELYEKYPTGFQATWFYDHIAELNHAIGGAGEFPKDPDALAQLLLWFDPEDLELYMDEDRQRLLINLQIPFIGSADYYEMKHVVYDYLQEHRIEGHFVGRVSSFFETGHRIGTDNLKGLAVSGVLIFGLLLLVFRNVRYAIIGIIVNAVPVLAGIALLGAAGIAIDMGSSVVAAMAFGIVLDDTTHLLVRLQQLQRSGYDPATAIMRAVRELIAPIVTTTLAVCIGFVVLFAAEMKPFHDFAMLMITTMFIALLADVILLPALVRQFMKDPLSSTLER